MSVCRRETSQPISAELRLNYCEYGRQSCFFEGRIAMTFSIQNMLEINTHPLAIFLPPVVNTAAFIR